MMFDKLGFLIKINKCSQGNDILVPTYDKKYN